MSRRWIWRGGIALLVVVLALVAVVATGDEQTGETEAVPPRLVDAAELRELASETDYPIYWAGEIPGTEIEVTLGNDGSSLVTYLEADRGGEASGGSLAIGTYPMDDPAAATAGAAADSGAITRLSEDGRTAVTNEASPNSVYFADPEASVQVEVYSASPQRAMRLALSEQVQPVE